LILLVVLLRCRGEEQFNYIEESHIFAAMSAMESVILPEIDIMNNLMDFRDKMDKSSKLLDR